MQRGKKISTHHRVSNKIRVDWGTMLDFCEAMGWKYNTLKVVLGGHAKSKPITDKLVELGYIESAEELTAHREKGE